MQKNETRWIKFAGVGAMALMVMVGCTGADTDGDGKTADSPEGAAVQNTVDSAQNSASNAADNVGNAAGDAGAAASNAASSVGNAASNAASKVADAGKNLDDAAVITPKVKAAFIANASLKARNINVSTTDKNVTLEGTVQNAAQKTLATNIAKQNAPGYNIVNNLKVAG
jgi:osmotically-inducible protein OsmY